MPSRWKLNERQFISRELEGEHIILHLDSGNYFTIEGSGALMFRKLIEGTPLEAIESALRKEYASVSEGTLRKDLQGFIRELEKKNIIQAA